jgi:hypothetical protein
LYDAAVKSYSTSIAHQGADTACHNIVVCLLLSCADILESIFAAPPPAPSAGQALADAASGSDLLQAALANSPSAAAAASQAQGELAGLQGAAAAAAAGLGVSAADVESLVSLAAKQAAKEEELAAARTQVRSACYMLTRFKEEASMLCCFCASMCL